MTKLKQKLTSIFSQFEKSFSPINKIEISRESILHNFDLIQSNKPKSEIFPVLKSNAYGHGIEQITEILKERNFPYIAVDGYYEALRIRKISKQPVLIMGYISHENYQNLNYENFAFVVHDEITIQALGNLDKNINIHLEINTGMNRCGIQPKDLDFYLESIKKHKNLNLEGVMSHLADADNDSDEYNFRQQKIFEECIQKIFHFGLNPKYIHIAQTAGSTKVQSKHLNSIRLGIGLYGINPLLKDDKHYSTLEKLKPSLSLKSSIIKIINLDPGEKVSYNCTFIATKNTKIGVLPLGYYEGINRSLSNKGFVKYKDKYFQVVGRICMNHTMIDITDSDATYGSEITVISNKAEDKNSIKNISHEHNLFSYELLTRLSENVRRCVVK